MRRRIRLNPELWAHGAKTVKRDTSLHDRENICEPEGFKDGSRWLSAAIPPVTMCPAFRTPKGCQRESARALAPLRGATYVANRTGGIASLNHRLMSMNPSGSGGLLALHFTVF